MAEKPKRNGQSSDSFNCEDVFVDVLADNTIRPCRPEHLAHARAERAKILGYLKAGFRPYADTEELAEAERLRLIAEYEAAIARYAGPIMSTSNRILLVVGTVAAMVLAGLWTSAYFSPPFGITERAYARIENGMSLPEVEAIIGAPCGNYGFPRHAKKIELRSEIEVKSWNTPATSIWVFLDESSRVADKGINVDTPGFLSRLASLIGLN